MGVSQSFRVVDDNDNSGSAGKIGTSKITISRLAIMKVLSRILGWARYISSCGKKKSISNIIGICRQITFVV